MSWQRLRLLLSFLDKFIFQNYTINVYRLFFGRLYSFGAVVRFCCFCASCGRVVAYMACYALLVRSAVGVFLLSVCRWCMLWYGFIMSTTLPCTLCQPTGGLDRISTDFHRIFTTRTRDSKNHRSGQKIHQDLLQKSALSEYAYMRAGKPKNFPGNDRLSDRCTHT